jgi:hypothetical protein
MCPIAWLLKMKVVKEIVDYRDGSVYIVIGTKVFQTRSGNVV